MEKIILLHKNGHLEFVSINDHSASYYCKVIPVLEKFQQIFMENKNPEKFDIRYIQQLFHFAGFYIDEFKVRYRIFKEE